jgi:hypothetical protein
MVRIEWDSVSSADYYYVERSDQNLVKELFTSSSYDGGTGKYYYEDFTASPGTVYYYSVSAYSNTYGNGYGSSEVTGYTSVAAYSLRDTGPAGGVVFYDDESDGVDNIPGYRYLEMAPALTSAGMVWSSDYSQTYAVGTSVGTGITNTTTIISYLGAGGYAAYTCTGYTANGYTDWFLPSIGELEKMYTNLKSGLDENGVSFIPLSSVGGIYWSSTERADNYAYAWYYNFDNNSMNLMDKTSPYIVRGVRAFN